MISIIMIDSRSDKHPEWVTTAVNSAKSQSIETELIIIDNIGRKKTIGECWNDGVRKAKYDLVLFLGDDDWISKDYCSTLFQYSVMEKGFVNYTTYMMAYDDKATQAYTPIFRQCTGMWRKDYLTKHPFNEKLERGIDREYIEEAIKSGSRMMQLHHHFGYYYRKHSDYSCSGDITFTKERADYYIIAPYRSFIDPLINKWKKEGNTVFVESKFDIKQAEKAKVIWCEWANKNAIHISDYKTNAKKYLRVHSFEAYTPIIHYIKWENFDKVIFVADHVKTYVEHKIGKIPNAVVIPVGIDLDAYSIRETQNNKICYAGELSRKKGFGELIMIARNLPDYEFYVAGKFKEEDVSLYANERLPENMTIHPFSYDLNTWLDDYTYFISTSIREGNPVTMMQAMAKGLKPLVYNWIGSEDIYGEELVFKNMADIKKLLGGPYEPRKYRKMVDVNNNFNTLYKKIRAILNP